MVLRKENGKERNKTQGAERTSADAGLPSAGSDLKASHLRWPVRLCLASLAFGEASSASRAKKRYEDPFSVDRPRAKTRPPRRAIEKKLVETVASLTREPRSRLVSCQNHIKNGCHPVEPALRSLPQNAPVWGSCSG
ncbi:hypothetical protein V511_03295 [Mesotoga sp. Brook.08.YT.4.2.5.1]|nr:hypothetical protein V511_03295 [Mesotoga sp. Brook.08.YT.4.2.5.1]PVD17248.1 hypothetical protein V512_010010 [Mesotoga sp. Brook.08.105.5.1]RAO97990.1 hypothetical protein M388_07955 [Mesotoga sp. Brook.08.YT.4.2.5.4.]RDI94379.1 hypothetical protein Q502_00070 [Mesotoga sp. Brook.08.YT.4.2.5.2.]